jgi:ABC-type multidrug transport system ATPase subunit
MADVVATQAELPPLIPVGADSVNIGRRGKNRIALPDGSISEKHATLRRHGEAITVTDEDSSNGTFVNQLRIRTKEVHVGDLVRFGNRVSYRVGANGLVLVEQGLSIVWDDVTLVRGGKVLVANAGFSMAPDSFVGILGPSGCGKSTILNSLAGFLRPASGSVTVDAQSDAWADIDSYVTKIGFVPQKDVFVESLTVRETLEFSAKLCIDDEEIRRVAVEDALNRVVLQDHALKHVSQLSGGQKRRLAVAVALLRQPRCLLLDEPTSGLDPYTEAKLMEQFADLAARGTTIVCTTHILGNLRLFGQVIVLGVKEDAGQRPGVNNNDSNSRSESANSPSFRVLNELKSKMSTNKHVHAVVNHVADVAQSFLVNAPAEHKVRRIGRIAYRGRPESLFESLNCRPDQYAELYEKLQEGRFDPAPPIARVETPKDPSPPPIVASKPQSTDAMMGRPGRSRLTEQDSSGQIRMLRQVGLLVWQSIVVTLRDRGQCAAMILQPLLLGALVTITRFFCITVTGFGHFERNSLRVAFFFAIVTAIWLGMNNSARVFVAEREQYVRNKLSGLIPAAFFGSRAAFLLGIGVVQIVTFAMLFRVFLPLIIVDKDIVTILDQSSFLWLILVLTLAYAGGVAEGFMVSCISSTQEAAVALLPLLIMPQLLLSETATQVLIAHDSERLVLRPLAFTLRGRPQSAGNMPAFDKLKSDAQRSLAAHVVELASLLCYARPATTLLDNGQGNDTDNGQENDTAWRYSFRGRDAFFVPFTDFLHLFVLLFISWLLAWFTFSSRERGWSALS